MTVVLALNVKQLFRYPLLQHVATLHRTSVLKVLFFEEHVLLQDNKLNQQLNTVKNEKEHRECFVKFLRLQCVLHDSILIDL